MGIIAGVTFGIAFSQVQNTLTTFSSTMIKFRDCFIGDGDGNKDAC